MFWGEFSLIRLTEAPWGLFHKATNSLYDGPYYCALMLSEMPPSKAMVLGFRILTFEFWKHKTFIPL